jgi:NDP-sugar pyrophosphorylase family protein
VTAIPSDAHLGEPNTLAFAGIHIIEPELLKHVPGDRFSDIIDCYRKLIHEGQYPLGHVAQGHYWRDVGTIESYVAANRERLRDEPFLLSSGCRVQDSARLRHWAVMGKNGVLEDGAEVSRSILWENVIVRKGARVMDSIVTDSKEVTSDLVDAIL